MIKSYSAELGQLRAAGMLRVLRRADIAGAKIRLGGEMFLNFASNDYLGLSSDIESQHVFLEGVVENSKNFLMGSLSSRLLGGDNSAFNELENFAEELFNAEISDVSRRKKCLVFNGGFPANSGVLPSLFGRRDLVVADKLVHASLVDALKLGDFKWHRFAHNNLEELDGILRTRRKDFDRVCIVTESVFSMDGDCADLRGLVQIKKKYDAALYVDEAHATGVFGARGLGMCEAFGVLGDVDILMCTLGKAIASSGALVLCAPDVREMLVNRCRSFVFTTAIAPINLLWTLEVLKKIPSMSARRAKLAELARIFRKKLRGMSALGDTQIAPVVFGSEKRAAEISRRLFENKIYAPVVRYPSVPKNAARIRFSLNADMSEADVCAAAEAVSQFGGEILE